ncbi:hypothetical protein ACFWDQ_27390 [Streptomyces sp. NPDC060053]|uniref:hypothetical protein n=1 Tax=Streptomyces sp. NPDC060053 TaxID=3347047 RepID=UPI0036C08B28
MTRLRAEPGPPAGLPQAALGAAASPCLKARATKDSPLSEEILAAARAALTEAG